MLRLPPGARELVRAQVGAGCLIRAGVGIGAVDGGRREQRRGISITQLDLGKDGELRSVLVGPWTGFER
jgi:hypothetical protein